MLRFIFPPYAKSIHTILVSISLICVAYNSYANQMLAKDNNVRHLLESWVAGYSAQIGGDKINHKQAMLTVYQEHAFSTLWLENNNGERILSEAGTALIARIKQAATEGLNPEDYHLAELVRMQTMPLTESFDLLLTDAFLTFSQHLFEGKINPKQLNIEWGYQQQELNPIQLIEQLNQQPFNAVLDSLLSDSNGYQQLILALAQLEKQPKTDWPMLTLTSSIRPYQQDHNLVEIARRLAVLGDLEHNSYYADVYDDILQAAVIRFQARHGLETDGIIGKNTITALNMSPFQRADQIRVNLERWRWMSKKDSDYYVAVNIPDYQLRVYRQGEKIMQMPVIVGKPERKTPVFSDKIRYLVVNPTWTVPQTLAIKDKLPLIKQDVSYLTKFGFTLYELGTNNVVDPNYIDWEYYDDTFPFRLVQSPGPDNALGQIKFMFPNQYDVYLHDTSSPALFQKNVRAFSSGCIRVSNPLGLAEVLLQPIGISTDKLKQTFEQAETTTFTLKQSVPIYIEYLTAWVDTSGRRQFRADIYDWDGVVLDALTASLH